MAQCISYTGKDCFNPRPLCRERHQSGTQPLYLSGFQSTPPMQGATCWVPEGVIQIFVSIHAPYAGSDPALNMSMESITLFQSTPPMQGATIPALGFISWRRGFNPRPLCRERHHSTTGVTTSTSFNPRPLCRERLGGVQDTLKLIAVSIHAPYAGSDV